MDTGWVRVGAAVRAARTAQKLTQEELGQRIGVSTGTIRAIERGQEFGKVTPTLRAVERAFGWGQGSIEVLQAGGDPLPGERPQPAPAPAPVDAVNIPATEGLPVRIAQALDGQRLDVRVMPLGPAGARMVVFVQGDYDASPEDTQAALLAWERRENMLERLGEELPDETSEDGGK